MTEISEKMIEELEKYQKLLEAKGELIYKGALVTQLDEFIQEFCDFIKDNKIPFNSGIWKNSKGEIKNKTDLGKIAADLSLFIEKIKN